MSDAYKVLIANHVVRTIERTKPISVGETVYLVEVDRLLVLDMSAMCMECPLFCKEFDKYCHALVIDPDADGCRFREVPE